ncbi:hypothetical protein I3760_15G053300 [Carya illinoinensis]|nr:hypothetical protein I3760_15G053300 [Carya illinoinensis]
MQEQWLFVLSVSHGAFAAAFRERGMVAHGRALAVRLSHGGATAGKLVVQLGGSWPSYGIGFMWKEDSQCRGYTVEDGRWQWVPLTVQWLALLEWLLLHATGAEEKGAIGG